MNDVPYGMIAEALQAGEVVPFLGAGASAALRPEKATWSRGCGFLPFGAELAGELAQLSNFPDRERASDLPFVASY
jgi:hypothetical protein